MSGVSPLVLMNQVMENIKSRRSRRNFFDKDIPDEIINEIIEAGRYAPSSLNKQPCKFIVITNKGLIKRLSSIVKEKTLKIIKFLPLLKVFKAVLRDPQVTAAIKKTVSSDDDTVFYKAPLLIMIAADRGNGHFVSKDCALAAQNMMLYAHSIGISSCFIGRADLLMMSKTAKDIIGLPPNHIIQAALVFGYSSRSDRPSGPERKRDNIINWIR